jgi:septal ring factor EnvC (AmiA/AmiB activator)
MEKYGSNNKSAWIGEVIEQWYLNNITEADRLENKLKWLEMKKKEVEDEIRYLKGRIEKLEVEKLSHGK